MLIAAFVVICILAGTILALDTVTMLDRVDFLGVDLDASLDGESRSACPATSTASCTRVPSSMATDASSTASIWMNNEP